MYSNIETPNNHHFPFGTNVGVMVLGVPILKHFRVNVSNYRRSRGRAFRAFKLVYMYAHTPPINIFLTVPRRYFRCGSSLLFLCLFVCNLLAVELITLLLVVFWHLTYTRFFLVTPKCKKTL